MAAPIVLFLPARDEEASVGDVVARTPTAVRGHPVVCVVVDDGSRDATAEKARGAGASVVRQGPRGLGAAVRTGLAFARTLDPVAIAFCDADGEYAPEELGRVVGPILDGHADYVVGSRFAGSIGYMHRHRRVGNRLLTLALALLTGVRVTDGQSGYRALSPAAAAAAEIVHDYNYAQVLTLDLTRKGCRYAEVPITYSFREEGRSFVRLVPYLRNVVPAVWRELRSPAPGLDRQWPLAATVGPNEESVFDDVSSELGACDSPLGRVDVPVRDERVGGRPRHGERVVRVVVREQALAPEVQ
jgi:glycosyltransferase involved in cell wall biosynthesis